MSRPERRNPRKCEGFMSSSVGARRGKSSGVGGTLRGSSPLIRIWRPRARAAPAGRSPAPPRVSLCAERNPLARSSVRAKIPEAAAFAADRDYGWAPAALPTWEECAVWSPTAADPSFEGRPLDSGTTTSTWWTRSFSALLSSCSRSHSLRGWRCRWPSCSGGLRYDRARRDLAEPLGDRAARRLVRRAGGRAANRVGEMAARASACSVSSERTIQPFRT